jgi:hypothetical protein
MMMRILIILLFYFSWVFSFSAQTISSKIVDANSGQSISYVNIGIVGGNIGTVSDSEGSFKLNLKNAKDSDTLKVSMISYETITFNIGLLRSDGFPSLIKMKEKVVQLKEVIISNRKRESIVLGLKRKYCYPIPFYKKVTSKIAFPQKNYSHEVGARFKNSKNIHLDSIQLNFSNCKPTVIKLRVNIYSIKNEIFKNILTEPIYISLTKEEILNFPIINLKKYSIILDSDFLISIENHTNMENSSLYILANFKSKGRRYSTYYRKNSQSRWTKLKTKKSKDFGLSFLAFVN